MIEQLKQIIELANMLNNNSNSSSEKKDELEYIGNVGRKVIVRSRDAGVLYGEYYGNNGSTIHLKNARQLWQWKAKKGITLIDVAKNGVEKSGCKFSETHDAVTVFNACALIDVYGVAVDSIEGV